MDGKQLETSSVEDKAASNSYTRKIAATAGGVALGLGGVADAGIIHFDNQGATHTVTQTSGSIVSWDIDGDATTDFTFEGYNSGFTSSIVVFGHGGNNLLEGSDGIAALGNGVQIGATVAGYGFNALPSASTLVYSSSIYAPFQIGDNKIAFSFEILGASLVGWANWNFVSETEMQITEWAYCDVDGCTIDVGETPASVPEPTIPALLLLGMGAAGVARWKKGKQEPSS